MVGWAFAGTYAGAWLSLLFGGLPPKREWAPRWRSLRPTWRSRPPPWRGQAGAGAPQVRSGQLHPPGLLLVGRRLPHMHGTKSSAEYASSTSLLSPRVV